MSIHNKVEADVSDDATQGTADNETILWGVGTGLGGHLLPTAGRLTRSEAP
jgi:hypothetical protein